MKDLKTIDYYDMYKIVDEGTVALTEAIKTSTFLHSINLNANEIGVEKVIAVAIAEATIVSVICWQFISSIELESDFDVFFSAISI